MLRTPPTPEMITQWQKTYAKYKDILQPNRKNGQELINYLKSNYTLIPFHDKRADEVIISNVMDNEPLREKLPDGKEPQPVTFYLERNGKKVFIGIDLSSGMYQIEDDEDLWDELCAYQGLDSYDLKNCYCVYEYISCLTKSGQLNEVIRSFEI
ncbi:MAG: hypothetical protein Q4F95_03720 [Oscillospiraceae bacterium]|nr:hypothetical protein [Oscillospiraceae bacterium]